MMIYQQDTFKLDAERITEETHPIFGPMTVFHDVVIASEIVQKYNDGKAFKSRDELKVYSWSVDGAWIIAGSHPVDGIISERDQVSGRTVNPRYVKNLKDPATDRPSRAGVLADIQVFNKRITPSLLDEMKDGTKQDVSIGFFFSKDETAGVVADGPFKDSEYDYVQRDMFHNHLAVGIDNGRCAMPYCGLGADEMKKMIVGDPFAGFAGWEECLAEVKKQNPKLTDDQAKNICGKLKSEHEDSIVEDDLMVKAGRILRTLLEGEYEALRGERDAMREIKEWWMILDWQNDEKLAKAFDLLDENIKTQIIEAGLCPTCGKDAPRSETERAMSHFNLSEEEWNSLSDEEKQEYIDKLPEKGSGDTGEKTLGTDLSLEEIDAKLTELKEKRDLVREKARVIEDKLYSETPEEKKRNAELRDQINQFWDEISDINDEIYAYSNAKTIKITEAALNDSKPPMDKLKTPKVKLKKTEDSLDPHEVLKRATEALEK